MNGRRIAQSGKVRAAAPNRQRARDHASAIQKALGKARFLETFDALYESARGDPALIPWADQEAHPVLAEWLAANGPHRGRALEVGCGLGDNALALSRAGYDVTAFDISPSAVRWARKRWRQTPVTFVAANLFDAPRQWRQAFDFVHETYTLQSLPLDIRASAFAPLASFLKPGGRMLVICRARGDDEPAAGPPWPLSEAELNGFSDAGLVRLSLEPFIIAGRKDVPHFLSVWQKPD